MRFFRFKQFMEGTPSSPRRAPPAVRRSENAKPKPAETTGPTMTEDNGEATVEAEATNQSDIPVVTPFERPRFPRQPFQWGHKYRDCTVAEPEHRQ